MKNTQFTKQERVMMGWLRFLIITFILVGFLFATQPEYFFKYIDSIGLVFLNYRSAPLEPLERDLWWILSLSLMIILVYASFKAQRDWLQFSSFVPIILLEKGFAFPGFLYLAFRHSPHFFYIVGSAIDGLLFLITTYLYVQAIKSRSFISPHTS